MDTVILARTGYAGRSILLLVFPTLPHLPAKSLFTHKHTRARSHTWKIAINQSRTG